MGSKRKSMHKIYRAISNREPKGLLLDLFCGGFAISEVFYKNDWKVRANDKNKYVVALLDQTINRGLDEKIVTNFITRSKFRDVINNPSKYDDWYVGFIQCIWSFGNTQKEYLFGKEAEPIKHAGHKLVIDKDPMDIQRLTPTIPKKYIDGILKQENWHKGRIALVQVSHRLKTRTLELQRLEQLERLEQLQQLERLEQLEITAKDYNEVSIPSGAVVYCDPPYQNTATYSEAGFNHDKFWEWCRKVSKTNHLYISEYNAPDDFKAILTFPQRSTLQGGYQKHTNQPDEKLFVPLNQCLV